MSDTETMPRATAPGERRQITVAFVDIVGSSRLASQTDAEDMAEWLEAYYARTRDVVEAHGGTVTEYLGDGVVACFGLQSGDELAASHAVMAALKLIEPLDPPRGRDAPVTLRVGVATGEVATRADTGTSGLPRVTGAVTSLADRIQEAGDPGQVLVAEDTRTLLRGRFRTVPLAPRELKGFAGEIRLFQVTGPSEGTPVPERADRPFVGRRAELARLQAADRPCLVVGEPGIGKSALAVEAVRRDGAGCWISGDGLHLASSHYPFRVWLSDLLRPAVPSIEALATAFPTLDAETRLPLAMVLGLPEGQRLLAEKANLALKPIIEQSLVRAIESRAVPGSWIVIEDLHWLDNASFGVLQALLGDAALADRHILLTSREDTKLGTHLGAVDLVTIALDPLDPEDATEMLAALGGDPVDDDTRRTLLDAAGGVPLYLEQLHQHRAAAGLRIPSTLMDLLAERIDACGTAKSILQYAAVLGRRFDRSLLAGVAGDEAAVDPHLDAAAALGVVERTGPDDWRFAHALLHQAAYHGILRRNREDYHARAAALLAETFPDRAAAEPVLLAEHHARARQIAPAILAYLDASQAALFKGALADAERHVRTALDLCHSAPPDLDTTDLEIASQTALGSVLMQYQGFAAPPVREAFEAVHSLAAAVGKPSHASAPAIFGSFSHAIIAGDMGRSEVFCDLLTGMAGNRSNETDMTEVQLAALAAENCKGFYAGDFADQFRHIAAIRELYDLRRHGAMILRYGMDIFAAAQMFEPVARAICGQAGQVPGLLAETDAHQAALNIPVMQPYALIWGAVPLFYIGAQEDALARLDKGIAEADAQGSVFWQIIGRVWHGVLSLEQDPTPETLAAMRGQLDTLAAIGTGIGMSYFEAVHARGLARTGDTETAWRQSKQAAEDCARSRLHCWYAEILRLHGLNCRDAGRAAEASEAFAEGLRVAEAQGADLWALRLLLDMDADTPGRADRLRAVADRVRAAGPVPDLDRVPSGQG